MQDDPFLNAVLNKDKQEDDPFLAAVKKTAGASAPVASVVPSKEEEMGMVERAWEGFKRGAKESISGLASPGALGPGGVQSSYTVKGGKPITREQIETEKKSFELAKKKQGNLGAAGGVGEFVGSVATELPISLATFGPVAELAAPAASRFLAPAAKKIVEKAAPKAASLAMREALEVGITTLPQEIISGSIAEAIVRPDAFQDWKSVARIAALSSIGSVFNMGGAYLGAIKDAKNLDELNKIQNQLKELYDDIADTGRIMPNVPEPQAGFITEGPGRQIPTAQQITSGRAINQELPDPNRLPSQSEAALNRINSWSKISLELQAQIDQRVAQLQNIVPKRQFDRLEIAAAKQEPDPILRAAQKATDDRLWEWIQTQGGGGKGVQTDTRIPLEGVSTPAFLTIDELNDHLRVLNMSSVMSEPKFKKGQRFIIPRTQLQTAEEIAARATGGPIKAVDKTVQAAFKNIQTRLDDAAARGISTFDPQETTELVNEMLAMSRRLSRGFEVPYSPRTTPIAQGSEASVRYVEGLDLPTAAKLDDPDLSSQLDPTHKRWVTGSDEPQVVDIGELPPTPTPPTPPVKEITEGYADAVRNANIDYSPKVKSLGQRTWYKLKNLKTEFYDRTWGVGKYDREAQSMLSTLSGASAHAEEFYSNQMRVAVRDADGVFRGNTRVVEGAPLEQLINNLNADEIVEADAFLKAATLLDEVQKNPKFVMDIDIGTARSIFDNAPQKIKDFAAGFKVISDALVDDMEATGRISAGRAAEMKSSFYAGLSRSFNEGTSQNVLKARTGSKRSSLPPIQLMRDNIFKTLEHNRKNAAYGRLIDNYEANKEALKDIIQPVDMPTALENVPGYTSMVEQLKRDGLTHNEATQIAAMQIPLFDRTNGTLRVFRDGEMSLWKVNEDIQKTMEALNPIEFDLFRSLLTGISAPIRTTTSLALDVSLVGPVADTFITSARVPGFVPIVDSVRGFFHSALKTEEYFERIAAGGGYGGRFEPAEVVVYKGAKATAIGKATDKLMHPLRWAQEIIRPLSDASRMGEYLVRRRGGETAAQAALASRRTLGDFNRVGASMRGWALMTEFGNVGIQTAGAAYELGRNALRELNKGNAAPVMRLMSTGVGAITLPTYYFWAAAQGDDELNAYRKSDQGYRFWWTRLPFSVPGIGETGDIVKYPKTGWWMGQVFGSAVEAALDGMDEEARKRLADGIISQVGLNPIPLKVQQTFGLMTNTRNPLSTGDNIPITPPTQQNLDASMQGNERTSPLARTLADNFGINPFKTDFIVESAGGSFFGNIVRQVGPNAVKLEKTDVPVLGRFAVKKSAPTEGSSQFYRDIEEARKFDESLTRAMDSGNVDKARKLEEENAVLIALRPVMEKHVKEIGEVNKWIYTITMDPIISPDSKREYIDNLRQYQNELFRMYAEDRKSWIDMR